eukprot:1181332-Prymnesium_polylepis.1
MVERLVVQSEHIAVLVGQSPGLSDHRRCRDCRLQVRRAPERLCAGARALRRIQRSYAAHARALLTLAAEGTAAFQADGKALRQAKGCAARLGLASQERGRAWIRGAGR